MRRTAALIVGGGPAGCAAALTLVRGGVRPELIERTSGDHDVVCGGFLGWDALKRLKDLGIDAGALGARPILRLRIIAAGRTVETDLPKAAAGLSRRRLDSALIGTAADRGADVRRGCAARAVDGSRRTVRLDDGETIAADALILATGKHEMRGVSRPLDDRSDPSAGLRTQLPASAALEQALSGVIELHLFNEGYAGLLLQEDGTANLCISISRRRLAAAKGIPGLVSELTAQCPELRQRIGGSPPEEWEAIAGVPYGWRAQGTQPGLFRVGDQAAVIASLAGDGIAIALASGTSAAKALLRNGSQAAGDWQAKFSRRSSLPLSVGEALRHAAERPLPRAALMRLLGMSPRLASLAARLTRID